MIQEKEYATVLLLYRAVTAKITSELHQQAVTVVRWDQILITHFSWIECQVVSSPDGIIGREIHLGMLGTVLGPYIRPWNVMWVLTGKIEATHGSKRSKPGAQV